LSAAGHAVHHAVDRTEGGVDGCGEDRRRGADHAIFQRGEDIAGYVQRCGNGQEQDIQRRRGGLPGQFERPEQRREEYIGGTGPQRPGIGLGTLRKAVDHGQRQGDGQQQRITRQQRRAGHGLAVGDVDVEAPLAIDLGQFAARQALQLCRCAKRQCGQQRNGGRNLDGGHRHGRLLGMRTAPQCGGWSGATPRGGGDVGLGIGHACPGL